MKKTILLIFFLPMAVGAGEAEQYVKGIFDEAERLREALAREYTDENKKKIAKKVVAMAFEAIDVNEVGRLALGRFYYKMSARQRRTFFTVFRGLLTDRVIEGIIPSYQLVRDRIPYTLLAERKVADKIFKKKAEVVTFSFPYERMTYQVDVYMYRKKKKLVIYDIHLDGSSYLLDFKNQFARIIRTEGFSLLIKRLRQRDVSVE